MFDIIGLMMLAEGEPKPYRRRTEATCGAPVARFGVWVGPFQIYDHTPGETNDIVRLGLKANITLTWNVQMEGLSVTDQEVAGNCFR